MLTPFRSSLSAFWKRISGDPMKELTDSRRKSSRLVGTGLLVDGPRQRRVALSISDSTLFYESRDITATLKLEWIQSVEYERSTDGEGTVMRLHCFDKVFEFILDRATAAQWKTVLPPR